MRKGNGRLDLACKIFWKELLQIPTGKDPSRRDAGVFCVSKFLAGFLRYLPNVHIMVFVGSL
jgi:hypothetical protein